MELIKKWGFTYKTCGFTWVKKNKKSDTWFWGCGFWTRANAEICLIATKGKPKRVSRSVHQICDARIKKHSEKPAEIRNRIVQLCGDLPRIELFARQAADGWDRWGLEAPEFTLDDFQQELLPEERTKEGVQAHEYEQEKTCECI